MKILIQLFSAIKRFYRTEKKEREAKYRIIGTREMGDNTVARVQVVGRSSVMEVPISEIDRKFAEDFPPDQRWYLGVLHAYANRGLKNFAREIPPISVLYSYKWLPVISMLYIAFLLLSNMTAAKIVEIWALNFPAAIVFFPLSYIFDDILTEVYGYSHSRRVIWTGAVCNIIFVLGAQITVWLPSASFWHAQSQYDQIIGAMPRTIVASILGYLCGEFVNSYLLAKLKILTSGRHYWLRLITSTACGVGIDSIIFCTLSFAFSVPAHIIIKIIMTQYAIKVAYEIISIVPTYSITSFLKNSEKIDYYDYETNFSPFSLSLNNDQKKQIHLIKDESESVHVDSGFSDGSHNNISSICGVDRT